MYVAGMDIHAVGVDVSVANVSDVDVSSVDVSNITSVKFPEETDSAVDVSDVNDSAVEVGPLYISQMTPS